MPDDTMTPVDVPALQARIVTLEAVARGNREHVGWLSEAYDEHVIALTTRDAEIARLRTLNTKWRRQAETAVGGVEELRNEIDRLGRRLDRAGDLVGRIHRHGTIPKSLQAEANNWIPDEWR